MSERIPHSRPTLGAAEADAAAEAVRSGYVAAGERTAAFERELAERVGLAGAVAVSSGTAALYATLKALDVGPGDEVLVPAFVCTALLHAVWATGAEPVVCDIADPYLFSSESARAHRADRTRAIILPHVFGTPAPVGPFLELGVPVIEDCAQSLGADCSGPRGVAAVFSFYATKMIATGEGGMVASDSAELLERVRDRIEYDKKSEAVHRFNLKFHDVAAAMGRVQLSRLDEFVARRRRIAERYDRALGGVPGLVVPAAAGSVYYRYVVACGDPAGLIAGLRERGVDAARPVDPPLDRVTGTGGCPASDRAWSRAVSLPIYPSLTDTEVGRVAGAVAELLR
jgi:dTDP-4-amino-4,6-dideoxygalactose transaminase